MADEFMLGTSAGASHWVWTGARLYADGGIDATLRYPDLTPEQRRQRVADLEAAWLAAQWEPPTASASHRFELRFSTDAEARRIQVALLVRVVAAMRQEAEERARRCLHRAADPNALPPHVRARPIKEEQELRTWLGSPSPVGSFVEIHKHLSALRITRGGSPLPYAVRHGYFGTGAAWDVWWREFAKLDFPAVLCVGFDPYDANNPDLRRELQRRTGVLEMLATRGVPSPLNPYDVPPDPAAQAAVGGYQRALARYAGSCYRLRVALVGEREAPATLLAALAGTLCAEPGAVLPVRPTGPEFAEAIREHQALGAPWLPQSHQQTMPVAPDVLDRLLHSLVDLPEAVSALSLPIHWPGSPACFDDLGD